MSLCEDCIKGVRHEGKPEGTWVPINGIKTYVGTPSGDYKKDSVLLFLTDVFGAQLENAQLLVDDFARNGIKAVAPDLFDGDALPADLFSTEEKRKAFHIPTWLVYPFLLNAPSDLLHPRLGKHGQDVTRPIIDKVIAGLKAEGVTKFSATGFCFGGRYVFDLAFENVISASIANHPSLLKSPDDLEKYFSTSRSPLLLNTCTVDEMFPRKAQAEADSIFGGGKFTYGYKREYFDGCTHGFAIRGDLSDPKVKAGKEGAFKSSVAWLYEYGFGPEGSKQD
ncbi:hypothetical protein D9757_014872 [Collybiopsis confluens]|uniref:Dienelactone hydrolase domain-containing protein n=1 Tax=Collybiopsis confluens TaxID=2823264 RepID=A0A8H5CG84_9AGAR|nr:hypothetical protein D9757_014872 [Collybiopsis confluens]